VGRAAKGKRRTFNNGTVDWYGAGKNLKSETGWGEKNSGTDDYGFSALPGGGRDPGGNFINIEIEGYWWTASEREASVAYEHHIGYNKDNWSNVDLMEYYWDEMHGFSVRCVKN
jgi:uncharacterized protein (TIGR02145 family)